MRTSQAIPARSSPKFCPFVDPRTGKVCRNNLKGHGRRRWCEIHGPTVREQNHRKNNTINVRSWRQRNRQKDLVRRSFRACLDKIENEMLDSGLFDDYDECKARRGEYLAIFRKEADAHSITSPIGSKLLQKPSQELLSQELLLEGWNLVVARDEMCTTILLVYQSRYIGSCYLFYRDRMPAISYRDGIPGIIVIKHGTKDLPLENAKFCMVGRPKCHHLNQHSH